MKKQGIRGVSYSSGRAQPAVDTNNIQGLLKLLTSYGGGLGPGSQKHSHSCQNSPQCPKFLSNFPQRYFLPLRSTYGVSYPLREGSVPMSSISVSYTDACGHHLTEFIPALNPSSADRYGRLK